MTDIAATSGVHRLHPLVKLVWLIGLTVTVFRSPGATVPWLTAGGVMVLLWCASVPPWRLPGLRMWLTLAVMIVAVHVAFIREGRVVLGPVTAAGLEGGLRVTGRLLAVVLASHLFVKTTDPSSLAQALMKAGLPVRWGFALVTALRLVPVLRVEAHHVYRAQLVRGMPYDARGPRRWWLLLRRWLLPLLVSALRTAHALSLAMEGRGFGLHPRRTFRREVRRTFGDVVAAALLVMFIAAAEWLARHGG
ncbi:MAG: energy-coupling factor transporter transmembrane component T [Planctomycetota bacterium]